MSANTIQDSINKAVDTIVKRRIEQLELDKTVLAIIDSNEGYFHGQNRYRLKYNGGFFSAGAKEGETYLPGTAVYVLVPQGDFSKDKFIISRASTTAKDKAQATVIATVSNYGIVGKNIVEKNSAYSEPYGVRSYHDASSEDIEKEEDETDETFEQKKQELISHRYNFLYQNGEAENKVYVNNNNVLKFKEEATAVMLRADFLTSLTAEQRQNAVGEYGLAVNLVFKNLAAGYGDTWGEIFDSFSSSIKLPKESEDNVGGIEWESVEDLDEAFCLMLGIQKSNGIIQAWSETNIDESIKNSIVGTDGRIDQWLNRIKSNIQSYYDTEKQEVSTIMRTLISNYIQMLEDMVVQRTIANAVDVYRIWWESDTGAQAANKIVTYYLTSSDMLGNPFSFTSWTSQYSIFSIDLENFLGIDSILFYKKGFKSDEKKESNLDDPNDIKVKNVQFYLMKPIADYNGEYQLKVEADENGTVFKEETTTITKESGEVEQVKIIVPETITMKAVFLRQMYEDLTKNSKTTIYWFKEDPYVNSRSNEYFREYAGLGWKVLNDSENWISNQEYWKITAEDAPAYENHFRCVVVYNGQDDQVVLKYDFTIFNNSKQQFVLDSDLGTLFGFDVGKPALTVYKIDEKTGERLSLDDKYKCEWTLLYQGQTFFFSDTENPFGFSDLSTEAISKMQSTTALLKNIDLYKYDDDEKEYKILEKGERRFLASRIQYPMANVAAESSLTFEVFISEVLNTSVQVYDYDEVEFVGKVSLMLSNTGSINVNDYRLVIENGNQVFQYNEYGAAPTEGEFKDKQKVLPLKAVVYNPANIIVTEQNFKTKWIFPANKEKSLIVYENGTYDAGTGAANVFTGQQVSFDIESYYDYTKVDNQVLCQVQFGDRLLEAETNFLFGKIGSNGTNGTEVVGRITPTVNSVRLKGQPVTIVTYYEEGTRKGFFNYNDISTANDNKLWIGVADQSQTLGQAFRAELYQKSTPLAVQNLKWDIAGNIKTKVNINGKDFCLENDTKGTGIAWKAEDNNSSNNYYHQYIVKAEMRNGDKTYYCFQGVPIIEYAEKPSNLWNNRVGIENDSYLKEIIYNSEGRNPQYNAYQGVKLINLPLEATENQALIEEKSTAQESWVIHWQAIGGYNASESSPTFGLLTSPDADKATAVKDFWSYLDDMVYILPDDEITGNITNNNVKAEIYSGPPDEVDTFLSKGSTFTTDFEQFFDKAINDERELLSGLSNNWRKMVDTLNSSNILLEIEAKEKEFDDNYAALGNLQSSLEELRKRESNSTTEQELRNTIGEINNIEWINAEIPNRNKNMLLSLLKSLQKICNDFISPTLAVYLPEEANERPIELDYWTKDLFNENDEVIITLGNSYQERTARRKEIILRKIEKVLNSGITLIREKFCLDYPQLNIDNDLIVLNKIIQLVENWVANNAIQAWIYCSFYLDTFEKLIDENFLEYLKDIFKRDINIKGVGNEIAFHKILTSSFLNKEETINDNVNICFNVVKNNLDNYLSTFFGRRNDAPWKYFVAMLKQKQEEKYEQVKNLSYNSSQGTTGGSNALVVESSIITDEIENLINELNDKDNGNFLEEKTEEQIKKEKWDLFYDELIKYIKIEFNKVYSGFYSTMINDVEYKTLYESNQSHFKLIATVYAPIHMSLNTFGLASINGWDGNHITMNEDDGSFLAPQVGAGYKDNNNRFTGILMGKAAKYGDKEEQHTTGLFGYSAGSQSIFLDAETGNAIFGLPSLKDRDGKELDYVEYYDGDERQIKDSYNEGQIKLIPGGVSTIGGWRFGQQSLYYTDSKEIGPGYRTDYVPDPRTGKIKLLDSYHQNHVKDINHNDSGILLHSGKNPYISIKGRVLTEKDISSSNIGNNLKAGDSLEIQLEPNTPTLFTILRHNGINRGSPNSRTYLAGINSKGELVANVVGSNISQKDDGTEGRITTMFSQLLTAFEDIGKEDNSTGESVATYVGAHFMLGLNSIGTLCIKNDDNDDGTNNLYISGGAANNSQYSRPISIHGQKVGLYSAQPNSTAEKTSNQFKINTSTITESAITLEPRRILMTLPNSVEEWDTWALSDTEKRHSVDICLTSDNSEKSYFVLKNTPFNINMSKKLTIDSENFDLNTGIANIKTSEYNNETATYMLEATSSAILKVPKSESEENSINLNDSKGSITLKQKAGSLIFKENSLTSSLKSNSSSGEYKIELKDGDKVTGSIEFNNNLALNNVPSSTGDHSHGNFMLKVGSSNSPAYIAFGASDTNYNRDTEYGPYDNFKSCPFILHLSGTTGGVYVESQTETKIIDNKKVRNQIKYSCLNVGMSLNVETGAQIQGIYKDEDGVKNYGLITEKGMWIQGGLDIGYTSYSSAPNNGLIRANRIELARSKISDYLMVGDVTETETEKIDGIEIETPMISEGEIKASGKIYGKGLSVNSAGNITFKNHFSTTAQVEDSNVKITLSGDSFEDVVSDIATDLASLQWQLYTFHDILIEAGIISAE